MVTRTELIRAAGGRQAVRFRADPSSVLALQVLRVCGREEADCQMCEKPAEKRSPVHPAAILQCNLCQCRRGGVE